LWAGLPTNLWANLPTAVRNGFCKGGGGKAAIQGVSGIDACFSKLAFSSEEWDRVMKFDLLIL
jgi:hypothetical protein